MISGQGGATYFVEETFKGGEFVRLDFRGLVGLFFIFDSFNLGGGVFR